MLNLFFPRTCLLCQNALLDLEHHVCIACTHELPYTDFCNAADNALEKTFYGRVPLHVGTALCYFHKYGRSQRLIHQLKYRGKQQLGTWSGKYLGSLIAASNRIDPIHGVVPVPLHPKKLKQRGYNQTTQFGRQIAAELKTPFLPHLLKRVQYVSTLSKRSRSDRWENVREQFILNNNHSLKNCHLLLVDDVVTTGATVEACYHALKAIPQLKLSLACIAFTK
jgi:ComF family protein